MNENSVFTQRFNMVMLPQERAMLQKLADAEGVKESALLRQWIGERYATRFGKRKPGAPVPKYNSAQGREAKARRTKK